MVVNDAVQRVLIVDDHPVVRFGLSLVLERAGGFAVCGEAGDVASASVMMARMKPDLLVLDLALGGRDGIELVRTYSTVHPETRILVFSAQPEQTYARRVFQAGGHGYLGKDDGVEKVPVALRVIVTGERYASPAVQAAMFQDFFRGRTPIDSRDPVADLSERELQVLRLLAAGQAIGDIARELDLSVKTIGTHRERLKNKLGADNARELAQLASELLRSGRV